jgi:DNA repair protein RecN (Recombination protein N)
MLKKLVVKNFALISSLELDPDTGFTTITGETGAGKSILLGALGLIAGQRADSSVLFNPEEKCFVEAEFEIGSYHLESFFEQHELDFSSRSIVRREINAQGKSRSFINDTPVNLTVLKELSALLIDIHSQHQSLALMRESVQLSYLDSYAGNQHLLQQYKKKYDAFRSAKEKRERLLHEQAELEKQEDYLRFQLNELEELQPKAGEVKQMEEELELLNHAEGLSASLQFIVSQMEEGEAGMLQQLSAVKQRLQPFQKVNEQWQEYFSRVVSLEVELKELTRELGRESERVVFDPERIEQLNKRLSQLESLMRKHQAIDEEALLLVWEKLATAVGSSDTLKEDIEKITAEISSLEKELERLAAELHEKRKKQSAGLAKAVESLLHGLGMPVARFNIELSKEENFSNSGWTGLKFLFSANKGSAMQEMGKVASGGELSRVVLAVKSIMASITSLPTILFDEIDTGVSGAVAGKMGELMREMGKNMQVIAITHLPQVAGAGREHWFVYKKEEKGVTRSFIRKLSQEERLQELAQMLSTGSPGEAALQNAKELLGS